MAGPQEDTGTGGASLALLVRVRDGTGLAVIDSGAVRNRAAPRPWNTRKAATSHHPVAIDRRGPGFVAIVDKKPGSQYNPLRPGDLLNANTGQS
jgi:hypothetical protein